MGYNGVVFAGTLFDINVAASAALVVLNPLLAQIDFTLFGSLGLGALQADLSAQLSAALQASLDIGIGISNPFAGFVAALAGIAVLQAQIQLALSGAIPTISIEAGASLSALASFSALLSVQIGGLEALIQAGLAVKIPAVNLAAQIQAALSAGPLFVLSFAYDGTTPLSLASVGASIAADFSAGLDHGPNHIASTDNVYGLVIVTKGVSAWGALQATMRTAP